MRNKNQLHPFIIIMKIKDYLLKIKKFIIKRKILDYIGKDISGNINRIINYTSIAIQFFLLILIITFIANFC